MQLRLTVMSLPGLRGRSLNVWPASGYETER